MVRASDSGSGDPGSILGRVGVFVSLSKRHLLPKKVLVIPRNRWLRLNMTEKLFTGTLNHNQNKTKQNQTHTCAVDRARSAQNYHKVPKFSDARKLSCNHPNTGKKRFYHRVMHPKDADSIANSED